MDIVSIIIAASVTHGVDPNLLKAICYKESKLRNVKVMDNGSMSYGICQIKKIASKHVGMPNANLMNPKENAEVAALYLKGMLNKCKNTMKAIGAYNTGKCIIPRTGYVQDVTDIYSLLESEDYK